MIVPVLDDDMSPVALTLFTMSELNDVKSRTQYRPLYSPLTRSYGDNEPQPSSIVFTGIVEGNNITKMNERKDRYMAAAARGEQWLKFYEDGSPYSRALRVGRLLNKKTEWVDQRTMRVIQLTLELELTAPFWQSLLPTVEVEELIEGVTNISLTNAGSRTTFPELVITGSAVTEIIVTLDGRSLHYVGEEPLGAGMLLIDSMRGITRLGSFPANPLIQDGSLFPSLAAGTRNLQIELIGGPGEATISYRDAWEL